MSEGSRGIGPISQALSSLYIYSSIGTFTHRPYHRAAVAVVLGLVVPICGIGTQYRARGGDALRHTVVVE
jgi:hypothetical protein